MIARLNRFVADHPWVAIVGFMLVTGAFAYPLPTLKLETDLLSMMPQDHPTFRFNDWTEEYFGIAAPALVGVVNEGPDGVFTPETLNLIKQLSDKMREHPLLDGEDLVSLTEVDNITGDDEGLNVEPFYEAPPATAAGARAVRAAVLDNRMMVGALVSADGQATMLFSEMTEDGDKVELYKTLQEFVTAGTVTDEYVFIAGRPVIEGEMTTIARRDLARMFPMVVAATAALLFLSMRCVRGAALPLFVVVTSVIWTLGLMAWLKQEFFTIMSMMPPLLIAIGVADGIHVIHHFLMSVSNDPARPAKAHVFDTMQVMARPVIMTSLTTAAGFVSLSVSPLPPIQSFGIYTAFGVIAAMVFSLTILPGLLAVLPLPVKAAHRLVEAQTGKGRIVAGLLDALTPTVTRRPLLALAGGILLLVVGLTGIPQVVVDGSLLQNFPPSNPVKLADAQLGKHFGGTQPLEIVLDAGEDDGWKDPARLRAVVAFQESIEADPHIAETRSIADLIMRMNEVMNPEDPDGYRVPDARDLVAQYLFLYSLSGDPDDFEDVVDYDYRMANVRARVDSDHSPVLKGVLAMVRERADEHLAPLGIEMNTAGSVSISYAFMDLIISGQIRSLAVAIVLCGILCGFMFRSIVAGALSIIPVSVASVLNFGLLAWFDVPLGVTTALLSSMGIGIGIDYAIHFIVKYQRVRTSGVDRDAAMHDTLSTAGVAIFYNAVVVLVGFLVLATSEFRPNSALGWLVALNMAVCFLGTITALAALLHLLQPAFVRPAPAKPAAVAT